VGEVVIRYVLLTQQSRGGITILLVEIEVLPIIILRLL
jgi:hypothetical protein